MIKRLNTKSENVRDKVEESLPEQTAEPPVTKSSAAATLPIWKFFSLYMPDVEKYLQAYLGGRFRGQMKTVDEWKAEIKNHIKEM